MMSVRSLQAVRASLEGTDITPVPSSRAPMRLGIEARLDPDVQADRHLERGRLAVAETCPENLEMLS